MRKIQMVDLQGQYKKIKNEVQTSFGRFQAKDRINIEYELYDHDEAGYTNGDLIHALFLPECILTEAEIFDGDNYIWSWKSWLNEAVIFKKLPKNEPILLEKNKIRAEIMPEKEKIPFLFQQAENYEIGRASCRERV